MADAAAKGLACSSGSRVVSTRIFGSIEERFANYEARVERGMPAGQHSSASDTLRTVIEAGLDAIDAGGDEPAAVRCAVLARRVAQLEEVLRAWQGIGTDVQRASDGLVRAREDTQRVLDAGRK